MRHPSRLAFALVCLVGARALAGAPVIEHAPSAELEGDVLAISAHITSSGGIVDARLFWRTGGATAFSQQELKLAAGGTCDATIPIGAAEFVEYFLSASDAKSLAEGTWHSKSDPFHLARRAPPVVAAAAAPDVVPKTPEQRAKPKIIVLEPQGEGIAPGVLKALDDLVLTELSRRPGYEVLGSSDVKRMLGVIESQQRLGCDAMADACLAEIGGSLGAQFLVSASLAKLETTYLVNLKLIDVLHARVIERRSERVDAGTDALASGVQRLAASLLTDEAPAHSTPLAAWLAFGTSGAAAAYYLWMTASFLGANADGNVDRANVAASRGNVAGGIAIGAAVVGAAFWLIGGSEPGAAGDVP